MTFQEAIIKNGVTNMFINEEYIKNLLEDAKNTTRDEIEIVLNKAKEKKGLNHKDIAKLLMVSDEDQIEEIYKIAGEIKKSIYGNRIVIFAPLYVSNFCVNNCTYCGYRRDNSITRRKLTQEEVAEETKLLIDMGHKRIALEVGEDPVNCSIDYVLECINTIYNTHHKGQNIRRINVNIAATTVENYKKLKEIEIGTYILFQETYHKPTYEEIHPKSVKGNYDYHTFSFDRAMEAGIEDVGGGVLFGLYEPKFEVLSLMIHNEHLEEKFGVGFHTISVPRLKKAEGMDLSQFPYAIDDEEFKRMVAIIRIAVPFTGIILSTRESEEMRDELLKHGVSQISAGSCTGVGGYKEGENHTEQFEISDHRTPDEILSYLMENNYIPSYCTACYRMGRTGDRFMQLAKSGNIQHVCQPNALLTLMEYLMDFGNPDLLKQGEKFIERELENISREDIRKIAKEGIESIKNGKRDIYL